MLLFNSSMSKILAVELTALETDSQGKIISSPRVVTSDQTEAEVSSGTEIPYQQATSSGATSVSFAQAALSLSVKPQITPDNNVIMDIKVNKDSVGQLYAGVPSINTNKVNTQVLVENGGTVVIGGIFIAGTKRWCQQGAIPGRPAGVGFPVQEQCEDSKQERVAGIHLAQDHQ